MSDEPNVQLAIDGPLAMITLNRPAKLNAIDPTMLAGLASCCARLEADDSVRVALLSGAGDRAFSVGADIHAWAVLEPLGMWSRWIRDGHRVFERLARLRQPVIAVLGGYTFGGGLELALTADLRLAAEQVELALPETGLATVPGWGATQRLPALVGAARAKQMILTGERVDARTAERWGLVNEVVPAENLMDRARALAGQIAERAPVAVQMAKQLIDAGGGAGIPFTLESLAGALAAATEDGKEGVRAFRERRPPQFKGR